MALITIYYSNKIIILIYVQNAGGDYSHTNKRSISNPCMDKIIIINNNYYYEHKEER